MIKAIIWDLDGVLCESRPWHAEALSKALHVMGVEYYPVAIRDMVFKGESTKKILTRMSQHKMSPLPVELIDPITRLKKSYTIDLLKQHCSTPDPRIVKDAWALRQAGYLMGVASGASRENVEIMLEEWPGASPLCSVVTANDVTKHKPDPEVYERVLAAINYCYSLGLKRSQCLAVEDGDDGFESAKAAGMHVLRVKGPEDVTYESVMSRIKEIDNVS